MDEQLEALILNWQSTKAAIDELFSHTPATPPSVH